MSAYSKDVSNEEVMASQFCADLAAAGLRVAVHPTAPDQTAQSAGPLWGQPSFVSVVSATLFGVQASASAVSVFLGSTNQEEFP